MLFKECYFLRMRFFPLLTYKGSILCPPADPPATVPKTNRTHKGSHRSTDSGKNRDLCRCYKSATK